MYVISFFCIKRYLLYKNKLFMKSVRPDCVSLSFWIGLRLVRNETDVCLGICRANECEKTRVEFLLFSLAEVTQ